MEKTEKYLYIRFEALDAEIVVLRQLEHSKSDTYFLEKKSGLPGQTFVAAIRLYFILALNP